MRNMPQDPVDKFREDAVIKALTEQGSLSTREIAIKGKLLLVAANSTVKKLTRLGKINVTKSYDPESGRPVNVHTLNKDYVPKPPKVKKAKPVKEEKPAPKELVIPQRGRREDYRGYAIISSRGMHRAYKNFKKVFVSPDLDELKSKINIAINSYQNPSTVYLTPPKKYKEEFGVLRTHRFIEIDDLSRDRVEAHIKTVTERKYKAHIGVVEMSSGETKRFILYRK